LKPERQKDLTILNDSIAAAFVNEKVIEIACGTGYWTEFIAKSAKKVVATDYNPAVIEIAKQKKYESLEKKDWDVLASDGNYPATRLSGVPLGFKESKIDYIVSV
jgi:ubiquinone/menaquinone biosynthesis C-methylase UbiE